MLVRVTNGEVELLGEVIPDSSPVLLLLGSANRDPRAFSDPDVYDLDRDTTKIASFGAGRHFCLGASLARLEARIALRQLAERVADYDVDEAGAHRVHSINVRGFAALPTTVTTAEPKRNPPCPWTPRPANRPGSPEVINPTAISRSCAWTPSA